jgi:DUF971 family protein
MHKKTIFHWDFRLDLKQKNKKLQAANTGLAKAGLEVLNSNFFTKNQPSPSSEPL